LAIIFRKNSSKLLKSSPNGKISPNLVTLDETHLHEAEYGGSLRMLWRELAMQLWDRRLTTGKRPR
jgi:hypothetical protein